MKRLVLTAFFITIVAAVQTFSQSPFENGIRLANLGNFAAALTEFDAVLKTSNELEPKRAAQIHFNLGVCRYQLGESETAVSEFEKAVMIDPNYEKAFYALGMAESARQSWLPAREAFRNAIGLNNKNAEAWFDLAFVYLAINERDAAKTAFENAARFKSIDAATSRNNIGVIMAGYGDFRSAAAEFERALKLSGGKLLTAARNLDICRRNATAEGRLIAVNFEYSLLARKTGE